MSARQAQIERKSKETEIAASLNIDGTGAVKVKTQIGLLDHMLDLFAFLLSRADRRNPMFDP